MSLEFNNEGEINAKQTNRNIILVLLISLMSASLAQNQLEFGLKSANPSRNRERKREREWERGKVESWQRSKWKSKHVACRSEPAINQNGPKKQNKTNNNSEGIKKERKTSFWPYSECSSSVYAVGCMHHCIRVWHPTRNRNRTGSLKQIVLYLYSIYVGKSVQQ